MSSFSDSSSLLLSRHNHTHFIHSRRFTFRTNSNSNQIRIASFFNLHPFSPFPSTRSPPISRKASSVLLDYSIPNSHFPLFIYYGLKSFYFRRGFWRWARVIVETSFSLTGVIIRRLRFLSVTMISIPQFVVYSTIVFCEFVGREFHPKGDTR